MLFSRQKTIKKESNVTTPWLIQRIENGLKCLCSENLRYFEDDQLKGEGAFKNKNQEPMSARYFLEILLVITPYTKGFIYNEWKIIPQGETGFSFHKNGKELFLTKVTLASINVLSLLDLLEKDILQEKEIEKQIEFRNDLTSQEDQELELYE